MTLIVIIQSSVLCFTIILGCKPIHTHIHSHTECIRWISFETENTGIQRHHHKSNTHENTIQFTIYELDVPFNPLCLIMFKHRQSSIVKHICRVFDSFQFILSNSNLIPLNTDINWNYFTFNVMKSVWGIL